MDALSVLYALFLGFVQGLTEFLPISSSAHLIIVSWFANGASLSLALNVALHLGTLSAVLIYFRADWYRLFLSGLRFLKKPNMDDPDHRILLSLAIGSLPAGIIGLTFKDTIETVLHHPFYTIAPLIIVGVLMWWGDKVAPSEKSISDMTIKDGFIIGCCQALALLPGTSRSGITILGARFLRFDRDSAARYSFLLGTPAMLGAALLNFDELQHSWTEPDFYLGFISSFVVGLIGIKILLTVLKRYGFFHFMIYRIILAIVLLFVAV